MAQEDAVIVVIYGRWKMSRNITWTKIKKQARKAITTGVEKLSKKYGFEETRCIANHYFKSITEKTKLEKEVFEKERELSEMRKKMGK